MAGPTTARMSVRNPVRVIASANARLMGTKLGGGRCGVAWACSPSSSWLAGATASSLTAQPSLGHGEEDRRPDEGRAHEDEQHDEHGDAHSHVPAGELSVHRRVLLRALSRDRLP